ncbi:TPA: hypothetical protein ACGPDF_002162, partial [Streptococcus suis]
AAFLFNLKKFDTYKIKKSFAFYSNLCYSYTNQKRSEGSSIEKLSQCVEAAFRLFSLKYKGIVCRFSGLVIIFR